MGNSITCTVNCNHRIVATGATQPAVRLFHRVLHSVELEGLLAYHVHHRHL